MANIFISHSTIDKGLADYLCNAFEEHGLSCWIAPRNIVPGAEWASSITNAIHEADVFFVLYSKNSIKSSQVTKEIGIADRKGKYMLPYKIDDTEPEGAFDYYLTGCQWVVVNPETGDYKIDELCEIFHGIIQKREEAKTAEAGDVKEESEPQKVVEVTMSQSVPVQKPVQKTPQVNKTTQVNKTPQVDKTAQVNKSTSVKQPKKNTAAMKERRRLFVGGGICLALLVCVIVAVVLLISGLNKDKDNPSASNSGLFNNIGSTSAKDFEYKEVDGFIVITGYTGTETDIVIPSEIDGKTVALIDEKAFYGCSNLTSVEIPNTIRDISAYAFYKCSSLTSVAIPDSVVFIGEHAFEECTSLTQIRLPDSVVLIDDFAFYKCTELANIRMSVNVEEIGSYAFAACGKLELVTLPDTLKTIGDMTFAFCVSMDEITIPDSIEGISASTFSGCKTITVYYKDGSYTNDIHEIIEQL